MSGLKGFTVIVLLWIFDKLLISYTLHLPPSVTVTLLIYQETIFSSVAPVLELYGTAGLWLTGLVTKVWWWWCWIFILRSIRSALLSGK